ncbi:MAG TPA: HAD-IC family P-type ATPase, partial [Allocoleopsis sp.]
IRKLPAVETLGSTTVICSDKTGTLTQNEMTVQQIWAGSELFDVSGVGYAPEGNFYQNEVALNPQEKPALMEILQAGLLCNDSRLVPTETGWRVEGDPTEAGLITAANKAGLDRTQLEQDLPRLDTIPFESQHQYMATLHQVKGLQHTGSQIDELQINKELQQNKTDQTLDQSETLYNRIYIKGSLESILPRCNGAINTSGQETELDRNWVHDVVDEMTSKGLRVLAFARLEVPVHITSIDHDSVGSKLVFLGLQGMIDPAREEAVQAVRACQAAGIKVKMITGDHVGTAAAIGRKIGLVGTQGTYGKTLAMSGKEIEELSDQDLVLFAERTPVFARVAPEQKLRLVKALQSRGHVVAMTGDGVNDGPALRQADIGIAMGITGTEVAKEAADMVLTDDNFATIEAAVEEGRGVYENIIKFIVWTLPTNGSLGLIILVSMFFGVPLPLLPLQVLWINTTTVIFLGTALAFEVKEPGLMKRSPRPPRTPLLK